MELHDYTATMQKEMIQQIESAKPKLMMFVNVPLTWLTKPSSVELIFKRFSSYYPRFYNLIGVVDVSLTGQSIYRRN